MTTTFKRTVAILALCASAMTISSCSNHNGSQSVNGQSGASQSSSAAAPPVDRSGKVNLPEVTGKFGEKPTVKAGTGKEPTQIIAKALHKGKGKKVASTDAVFVNYTGTIWKDGTVFDSSFDHGTPFGTSLDAVIPGWKYGLAEQNVGDRVELAIPADQGYGPQSMGKIPANSTLVFVVDILDAINLQDVSELKKAKPTGDEVPQGLTVKGQLGEEPQISITDDQKLSDKKIILAEGTGPAVTDKDWVVVRFAGAQAGQSRANLPSTWKHPEGPSPVKNQTIMLGEKVGSRILMIRSSSPEVSQSGQPKRPARPAVAAIIDIVGSFKPDSPKK